MLFRRYCQNACTKRRNSMDSSPIDLLCRRHTCSAADKPVRRRHTCSAVEETAAGLLANLRPLRQTQRCRSVCNPKRHLSIWLHQCEPLRHPRRRPLHTLWLAGLKPELAGRTRLTSWTSAHPSLLNGSSSSRFRRTPHRPKAARKPPPRLRRTSRSQALTDESRPRFEPRR